MGGGEIEFKTKFASIYLIFIYHRSDSVVMKMGRGANKKLADTIISRTFLRAGWKKASLLAMRTQLPCASILKSVGSVGNGAALVWSSSPQEDRRKYYRRRTRAAL